MEEIFSQIWVWIVSALGGISLAGIITAVIYGSLKGAFNRAIAKVNVEKISEEATEKGIEQVKKISFTQSIQPVVESELKKVTESANEYIKANLEETQENYNKLLDVLLKFSAFFDGSIYVSDEARDELKTAIEEAKYTKVENNQEVTLVSAEQPAEEQPQNSTTSASGVQR